MNEKMVPIGILAGSDGQGHMLLRDFDSVILPSPSGLLEGVRLSLQGWRQLVALGPVVEAEILACQAREAEGDDGGTR